VKLHVETCGRGPMLVLLHGWGMNSTIWSSLLPGLTPHFRVTCVDLPGHGASQPAQGCHSLRAMAASVAEVAPHGAAWLGWSLGGQVALAAALAGTGIRRLVLVATTPKFLAGPGWPCGMAPATLAGFAAGLEKDHRKALRDFLVLQLRGGRHTPEMLSALRRLLTAGGDPAPTALAASLRVLAETDLRPRLSAVSQPALVIAGERDRITPPEAGRRLASGLKEGHYLPIAGVAHAPFLARHAQFCAAVTAFLLHDEVAA
jgi:pimeloyl-[acyl-carrier protein] methyl ester esterase